MCGPLEENHNDPKTLSAMGPALGCDTPVLEASRRRHHQPCLCLLLTLFRPAMI